MWSKTNVITLLILLLSSSVLAYRYSASQGQKTVYADDLEGHGSLITIPSMLCNNNPSAQPKTLKPSQFIDFDLKNLYVWKNTTIKIPSHTLVSENETRYNSSNGTYQVTVVRSYNSFSNQVVEGWEVVPFTSVNKNNHKSSSALTFAKSECKEFRYEYYNTLQPINSAAWKYSLGEDTTIILDPILNATDYQMNATLDNNASRTTATITNAFNITSGNFNYPNSSTLISMWQMEDATGATGLYDTTGRNNLTIKNPTNFTTGITGYFNNGVRSNGSNNKRGGFACAAQVDQADEGAFSLELAINTTEAGDSRNQSNLITVGHINVVYAINGQLIFNPATDNCPGGGSCDSVITTTNFSQNLNTWKIVLYNYNGTHSRLWVDDILENTSAGNFSIAAGIPYTSMVLFGGNPSEACSAHIGCDGSTDSGRVCFQGMIDQVRWWNTTITSSTLNQSKYFSNAMSIASNITRFRVMTNSTNPSLLNASLSFDGGVNFVQNVTNGSTYNWSFSVKTIPLIFGDLLGPLEWYGLNFTAGTIHFSQAINNRNISHNGNLNISLNATDDLTPVVSLVWNNNGTQFFTINSSTGEIAANFSNISLSGTYQIRVNVTQNNVTAYEIFNLTLFNSAPIVTSVSVSPSNPSTNDPLSCVVVSSDAENDYISTFFFEWYRNDALFSTAQNITGGWSIGDMFKCNVMINDGLSNSTRSSNSSVVTTTSNSGGGGSGDIQPPPANTCGNSVCDDGESNEVCPVDCPLIQPMPPPLPVPVPLYNPPPDLEKIFVDVVPPEVCGDGKCSQGESYTSCSKDCPFDIDVIGFELLKRGPECKFGFSASVECRSNTNFILGLFLGLFLLLLFIIIVAQDKKKKKKRK